MGATEIVAAEFEVNGSVPMWKSRREDEKPLSSANPQPPAPVVPASTPTQTQTPYQPRTVETPRMDTYRADVAHIGKSVIRKGELSGSEDLYLDGEVEGNIDLRNHNLVIGPNGRVRANVQAKDVAIHGKVDGKITASDKVELKKSAVLNGDIDTLRIVIEDGAFFKGSIDIRKGEAKAEAVRPVVQAAAATPTFSAPVTGTPVGGASSLAEKK
jgi:cytoskeletal protein CcmA (bactofilin family)